MTSSLKEADLAGPGVDDYTLLLDAKEMMRKSARSVTQSRRSGRSNP